MLCGKRENKINKYLCGKIKIYFSSKVRVWKISNNIYVKKFLCGIIPILFQIFGLLKKYV